MAAALFREIYHLDTLDTRLTTPSNVPYRLARPNNNNNNNNRAPSADPREWETPQQARIRAAAGPPRWRTPEFVTYFVLLTGVVPYMFWVAYGVSRPADPRWGKFERLLSPGWIPGRRIDNSDAQYRLFRGNLPYLTLLLVFHPLIRRAHDALSSRPTPTSPSPSASPSTKTTTTTTTLAQRTRFDAAFALLFLFALHGFSALKILAILALNYRITTRVPRAHVPAATWAFNIAVLFANELGSGYRFASLARFLADFVPGMGVSAGEELVPGVLARSALERFGLWMDSKRGLVARWEILFNITVLRMISYNMDRYWSQDRAHAVSLELDLANLSERDRVAVPAPASAFSSFATYLAYTIYAPLYLTGPIVTFNDYISQSRHRPATISPRRTLLYALRLLLALLAMELVLHYIYVGAISKSRPDWSSYRASQLALLSYFNLHIIWLKLLIPWRLARLWALLDGLDPPENMLRCVSDNFSTLLFWRAWHRSFNRWIVRYLFVPLGGSSFASPLAAIRSLLSYVVVFTFVALWHDIKLRLLVWGWLIVLFMLPEMAVSSLLPKSFWSGRPTTHRMVSCAGAVCSVFTMMAANLVGYALGIDGLKAVVVGIFADASGLVFLLASCGALFIGVQIMFEVRQAEMRRGIDLKC